MPRPYSNDLRERVVQMVAKGYSARGAAGLLGISVSSAIRWVQRARQTGSAAAKPTGGDRRSLLPAHSDWLLSLIAEKSDLTLKEIRQRLREEKSVTVGLGTLWRFFAARKISFKKSAACRRTATSRRRRGAAGLARQANFA
jgi:transposase